MAEILHARVSHTIIIRAKVFFSYNLPIGQGTSVTDRQMDRRTTTMPIARPLLKYG